MYALPSLLIAIFIAIIFIIEIHTTVTTHRNSILYRALLSLEEKNLPIGLEREILVQGHGSWTKKDVEKEIKLICVNSCTPSKFSPKKEGKCLTPCHIDTLSQPVFPDTGSGALWLRWDGVQVLAPAQQILLRPSGSLQLHHASTGVFDIQTHTFLNIFYFVNKLINCHTTI